MGIAEALINWKCASPGIKRLSRQLLYFSLAVFIFSGCAPKAPVHTPEPEPATGDFYTGEGEPLSPDELIQEIAGKDFILIGETHDNPCHHRIQAKIMDLLASSGQKFVLGLEMVNVRKQDVLDSFNRGEIPLDDLPDRLEWSRTWGHDFDLYRPVFKTAREHDIPVKALNLPSGVTRRISHFGLDSLGPEDLGYLPEKITLPPEEQLTHLEKQYEMHKDFIPRDRSDLEHFIQAQSAWDSKMAEMAGYYGHDHSLPVMVLAGSEHVRRGWGIEHRLLQMDKDADITRVLPVSDPGDISPDNPFYFYCPPAQGRMRLGLVISRQEEGLVLAGVVDGSAADRAGFQKGDEIIKAGDNSVQEMSDLHDAALKAAQSGEPVFFQVRRSGEVKTLKIELPRE